MATGQKRSHKIKALVVIGLLIRYIALSIQESLTMVADLLIKYGLKERIRLIGSGKLITPAEAAWAMCGCSEIVRLGKFNI
jgi:glutamate synthase domain-containing protein 2